MSLSSRYPDRSSLHEAHDVVEGDVVACRILLIEDNPDGGLLLENALEAEADLGFEIHQVESIADGAAAREHREFDVIMLDLGLVESRGLDTLARAQAALPDLPIIVLTGNDDPAMGIRAVQAGAEDYIVKGQERVHEIWRCIRYARERHRHVEQVRVLNAELKTLLEDRIAELEVARERAARSNRMAAVGTIAAGVAHELNSPLMGVINHFQAALAELPDGESRMRELLAAGLGHARRCADTIGSLLQHAREQGGAAGVDPSPGSGDVCCAVGRVVEDVCGQLGTRAARVKTELPPSLPVVSLDQSSLEVVLRNLLRNACDAMEGASSEAIRLSARAREREVEISVYDSGHGMSPEDLALAFEPFYTTRPGVGTGLGLALCKRLVEGAGGRIYASSREPAGSVFTFTVPTSVSTVPPIGARR